ncbi:MAG: 6,7-dimethyl-8-ribityllumazine synthase [Bacteroidia bacterium]|nr:6,7-dimethyl-8-ribityllumazine synthase [Bacteroidia bacterium]MDW8416783.1 6,7-dimethyl-8-ribityllumazine synthase [Bacteroidia bacterium]
MKQEDINYIPPQSVVERARVFILRTVWHSELTQAMENEARVELRLLRFPEEKTHTLIAPGAFELVHLSGVVARLYAWKRGFSQIVSVRGPTQIQSNLRLPPFFQGNFDSQLRSEFLLDSPGPIGYLQPYEPTSSSDELPIIITMGCILKGETEHNRYLAHAVLHQLAYLSATTGIPIIMGILTPDTLPQAWERVVQAKAWVKSGFLVWESRLTIDKIFGQKETS